MLDDIVIFYYIVVLSLCVALRIISILGGELR